jgi:transcriptional regulator with XRE-family HTH domain
MLEVDQKMNGEKTPLAKLNIGGQIRRLRLEQRRTQQDIAMACGFTKSLLCKIESNAVVPTVATLVKIGGALGVKVSTLIESDGDITTVHTKDSQVKRDIVKTERGLWIFPFASGHKGKRMQPFMCVIRKGEVKEHHMVHEGEEFMYVLEGEMRIKVGSEDFLLQPGDGLYFNSTDEHQVFPLSDEVKYLNLFI